MKKVSDLVFDYLADVVGVKHVFMLPGGGCMHLVDSLGKNRKLKFVCNLHEQASAIGAEAYGQYTNNLGVTLVTAGPGSTNAITGVAGAWIDSTPMLVLSGQAKTEDLLEGRGVRQMGIQEVDIVSIVSPVTKYACCVKNPAMIKFELQKAIYLARHGRKGPVWLDIPLDTQGAMVDENNLLEFVPPEEKCSDLNSVAKTIVKALASSRHPAILVGNGIRLSGALENFLKLINRLNIPVLTTWKAADFLPETHRLFTGRPGIVGQRGANFVQQFSDMLLIIGARLDLCQTGFNHPNFAPRAKKIIVDIDEAEIKKLNMEFEYSLNADAGLLIEELLKETDGMNFDYSAWLRLCKEWQTRYPVVAPEYLDETASRVNTYHLVDVLSELLDDSFVVVPGSSGACAEITMQAIKIKKGQRILNTPGLGSMGFGLPASIGAAVASDKKVVSIIGDGGMQHNIQELQTLKTLELPIKIFVLDNSGYGSICNMQKARFNGNLVACNADSGLKLPDISRLAAA
ncbi:MAG: thiamine pyrophosphate-binding protein, partial [Victivallaceae bacterium]|nr:thiamine pyrophosphate-binding protein [Victivallaceae bacterium]